MKFASVLGFVLTLWTLCICAVSSELQLLSTGIPGRSFDSPTGRIKVGNAVDVIVEVKCASSSLSTGEGSVNWTFAENGTAVSRGLKPFGTSQGEGGVLRIYPVNILSPSGTAFQCRDARSDQTLNVTFELQENLFFQDLNLQMITNLSSLVDECRAQVPDIPLATVSVVNKTNPLSGREYFFCQVETERGMFRSGSLSFHESEDGSIPTLTQIFPRGNEVIRTLDSSMLIRCIGGPSGHWLMDGTEISPLRLNIPSVTASNSGLYQCIVFVEGFPEFAITESAVSLYTLVQVLDVSSLEISGETFTIGQDDELVSLNCSVSASPLPLLEWSRAGVSVEGAQAPTGFMETAHSILTINITELGVGSHTFECTASVATLTTQSETSTVMKNITIQELQNVDLVPKTLSFITDGDSNETLLLNCSVEASPAPAITWLLNGAVVEGDPVNSTGETVFFSSLALTLGELEFGENNVTCTASLNVNVSTAYTATITVNMPTPPPTTTAYTTPSSTTTSMNTSTTTDDVPSGVTTLGLIDRSMSKSFRPEIIAAIAAVLFVFVCLLIMALVVAIVLCVKRQSHSQKKRKSVFPSQSGVFTAMTTIDGPANGAESNGVENGANSVTLTSFKNLEAEPGPHNMLPVEDGDIQFPMTVEVFPSYCLNMHKNSDHAFAEEFRVLSIRSPNLPHAQASRSCNVAKNRYANIRCNDETRVQLDYMSGVDGSDFIHANFIDGYHKINEYVATQGPLPHTTYDFWRMVWELNTSCIVMLTNLVEKSKTKCHPYWPELVDGTLTLKDMLVSPVEVQQLAYFTVRSFKVTRGDAPSRLVKQFHYTGWPDFGVPDCPHPIISFIRHLDNFVRPTKGPDIVHCSAGVGRTGALITIQSMMRMIEKERKVDIFNFVLGMRCQRNLMVQTERQYTFIHDVLLEVIQVGNTEIPLENFQACYNFLLTQDEQTKQTKLEEEFYNLNKIENVKESKFKAANKRENAAKNRFQTILPYDKYRVHLEPKANSVDRGDYINASFVDGYKQPHQYILTQGPLANTVNDFWRMVWEQDSYNIVMLCEMKDEDGQEQCTQYWPEEKKIIRQYDRMFVEMTEETDCGSYTRRELSITNTNTNEKRVVWHYQLLGWSEKETSKNCAAVIELIEVLHKSQSVKISGGPIVAHDSTSVGRSGTFCVMSSVLEQLKVEGIVDLFFTIHSLRQQQPGLVQTPEQYQFCYDAVLVYLESYNN